MMDSMTITEQTHQFKIELIKQKIAELMENPRFASLGMTYKKYWLCVEVQMTYDVLSKFMKENDIQIC